MHARRCCGTGRGGGGYSPDGAGFKQIMWTYKIIGMPLEFKREYKPPEDEGVRILAICARPRWEVVLCVLFPYHVLWLLGIEGN